MQDDMQDTTVQTEDAATQAPEQATEKAEKEKTLDDIEKKYFPPDTLEDAATAINEVMKIPSIANGKVKPLRNFKEDEDLPDGFGIWILPIAVREKAKDEKGKEYGYNKTVGVVFATVPDLVALGENPKGEETVRDIVSEYMAAKVANSVRPRGGALSISGSMPQTVEDFIENRKQRGSLKTWNELADDYVKFLKDKGMRKITKAILKRILQSKSEALSIYDKMENEGKWLQLLDHMIATAQSRGLDTTILEHWKETREEAEFVEEDDVDLSEIDVLFADEEDESEDAEQEAETA